MCGRSKVHCGVVIAEEELEIQSDQRGDEEEAGRQTDKVVRNDG